VGVRFTEASLYGNFLWSVSPFPDSHVKLPRSLAPGFERTLSPTRVSPDVSDARERLAAALSQRYRIERELGQGGMATVYLAEDLKHHRKVAVKVLRPDLAASLGAERFLREIEVAARLQHPHILGVLDSGDADGFFYYVMPFVEGETLRDRIARSGELPVPEAVRLLSEIAEALAVAHHGGVVHRDIKPENILLSGRHALVMDFGVAKAVTEASGRQELTTAGVALGTPAYMAPEQASADPQMDNRVDIYAMGVMGYEMLTGYAPFHGLNPQQTLVAHITKDPTPVGQQRGGLSPALEAVIMRCLAKRPADRFQTADELASALEPLATSGGITPTATQPVKGVAAVRTPSRGGLYAGMAVIAVIAAGLLAWRPWARGTGRALDTNVVAVLPFRVAGADPSVQYLRQGMVDLLQAKLTGQGGPRAADTRSVLAAFRDAGGGDDHDLAEAGVERVARSIGSGQVLQGSIVGPPDNMVISATLQEMPGGRTVAQASVTGPRDSLFVLVDRLTAQVLALGAGARANQLSALTTTNLDALRAYLDGVGAYRRGAYQVATPTLQRAVELDSTFALALGALVEADGWHVASTDMRRVRRLAWQYRDRLNPQDQVILKLRLGSRFPVSTPWDVQIADAERAVQTIPESAEAWYLLGDALFHAGRVSDLVEPEGRAKQAFEKAFKLDSLYSGPITHMARVAFTGGDTAAQRVWSRRMIALDSASEGVQLARWDLLQASRDSAGIAEYVSRLESLPLDRGVQSILFQNPADSITIAYQPELLRVFRALAATPGEREEMVSMHIITLLNRGRPGEARRWIDSAIAVNPRSAGFWAFMGGLYFGGEVDSTVLPPDLLDFIRIRHGDAKAMERSLAFMRERVKGDSAQRSWALFLPLTEAMIAVARNAPNAERLVDVADSLWRGRESNIEWVTMELSRLYQAQGRTDRALRAIRRRWSSLGEPKPQGLAESYRIEGELAALAGDKAGAIRAYRNYLKLRVDPEPSRIPQRDSVRAALAALGDLEKAP